MSESSEEVIGLILSKSLKACAGVTEVKTPRDYSTTSTRLSMFNSLQSRIAASRLEQALYKLGGAGGADVAQGPGIPHYLSSRWYGILVLVAGLVLLVCATVACCRVTRKKKARRVDTEARPFSKRNSCSPRKKAANDGVPSTSTLQSLLWRISHRARVALLLIAIAAFVILAVTLGYGVHSTIDHVESHKIASCNMYLDMLGYFRGAEALVPQTPDGVVAVKSPKDEVVSGKFLVAQISRQWLGSSQLLEKLEHLRELTRIDQENVLHRNLTVAKAQLLKELHTLESGINQSLASAGELADRYDAAVGQLSSKVNIPTVGSWKDGDYSFELSILKSFRSKSAQMTQELSRTILAADKAIDSLLSKYAGSASKLMNESHQIILKNQIIIQQINSALEQIYHKWDGRLAPLLKVLSISLVVLFAIVAFVALFTSVTTIHLSSHTLRTRDSPASPSYPYNFSAAERSYRRRYWKISFCVATIALGLSALFTGLTFFTGLVGADICHVLDENLLTNGNWNLLGKEVLFPPIAANTSRVDMRAVFDVCLKRSGTGAIGVNLGLDEPISEINEAVSNAIDDIRDTRERLLRRHSSNVRVRIVGFMLQDILEAIGHKQHYKIDSLFNMDRVPVFDRLQDITFGNWTADADGRRVMLSVVPNWPSMIGSMGEHGIFSTTASIVDAYNVLNALSAEAFARNPATTLPRFCGALARKRGLACAFFEEQPATRAEGAEDATVDKRPIVDLADPNVTQTTIDKWLGKTDSGYGVDADLPTWMEYKRFMGARLRQLIGGLQYVERAANVDAAAVGLDSCKSTSCTFDDARQLDAATMLKHKQLIEFSFDEMLRHVDAYVEEAVVPSSQSVVDLANKLIFEANCQFQGTTMDYAVYAPLCTVVFPAIAELAICGFIVSCVLFGLAALLYTYRPLFDNDLSTAPSPYAYLTPPTGAIPERSVSLRPPVRPDPSASESHYDPASYSPIFAKFVHSR